jgi:CDP-diacylglycerol--glycerol-3-phosphate 3-phosphatidyltransferase
VAFTGFTLGGAGVLSGFGAGAAVVTCGAAVGTALGAVGTVQLGLALRRVLGGP